MTKILISPSFPPFPSDLANSTTDTYGMPPESTTSILVTSTASTGNNTPAISIEEAQLTGIGEHYLCKLYYYC